MCFGGPQAPNIVRQGPSPEEIAANQASLDAYKAQAQQQQEAFAKQLQDQIEAANKQTAEVKARYDAEAAAAAFYACGRGPWTCMQE